MAVQLPNLQIPADVLRRIVSSAASVMGIVGVVGTTFAVTSWTEQSPLESGATRPFAFPPHTASPPSEQWTTPFMNERRSEIELTIYVVSGTAEAQVLERELAQASNIRAVAAEPPFDYSVVVLARHANLQAFDDGNRLALQVRFESGLPPIRVVDLR